MVERRLELLREKKVPRARQAALEDLTDDELMLLVARDNKEAFETLLLRHQPLVQGYATRFLGDARTAEDVTQEVFLRIWKDRTRYRPEGRFKSYMLAISFNFLRDSSKRQSTARKNSDRIARGEMSPGTHPPLDQLLEKERAFRLHQHLLGLNDNTRSAILFRYGANLSYEEISCATRQPVGTIKSLVSRGLKELNAMLAPEDKK